MAFTDPPPDLDAAQDDVDRAQAALEGTRLLVAEGRAGPDAVTTAMFNLRCAQERLAAAAWEASSPLEREGDAE